MIKIETLKIVGLGQKFNFKPYVCASITAPLYWWRDFDKYQYNIARYDNMLCNIIDREFKLEDFSIDGLMDEVVPDIIQQKSPLDIFYSIIDMLNICRDRYLQIKSANNTSEIIKVIGVNRWNTIKGKDNETKRDNLAKEYLLQIFKLLPNSYNNRRLVSFNYEILETIHKSLNNYNIEEWEKFYNWIDDLLRIKDNIVEE